MANSTLQRPHRSLLGLPRSGTRSRHEGHTRYRSPISTLRGTLSGRGTTVHLRGGVLEIWRKARTTATGVPFTSTTAASPWARLQADVNCNLRRGADCSSHRLGDAP